MVVSDRLVDDPLAQGGTAEDGQPHHGLPEALRAIMVRLADRTRPRSEATLQADIRQLLLNGDFGLGDDDLDVDLETQVGDGRRIDIEAGFTVIEVKKSLAGVGSVRRAARPTCRSSRGPFGPQQLREGAMEGTTRRGGRG